MRLSLSAGNRNVKIAMKETKHDKEKTYEKAFAMMLSNCYSNIDASTTDMVSQPEGYNRWNEKFDDLLEFNRNVFQIIGPELQYTKKEQKLLDIMKRSLESTPFQNYHDAIEKVERETENIKLLAEHLSEFGLEQYMVFGGVIGFVFSVLCILMCNCLGRKR